jgi:hypothetical protein
VAENDNFDYLRDGKALKNIREFQNIILTTKDNVKQLGVDFKNATGNSTDMAKSAKEVSKTYESVNTSLRNFVDLQSKVFTSNKSLVSITKDRIKQENRLYQIKSDQFTATRDFLTTQTTVKKLDEEILDLRDEITTATAKEKKGIQENLKKKKEELKKEQEKLEIQGKYAEEIVESKETLIKIVDEYKNLETFAESINGKVGFFNGMAAFVKDIPGLGAISKPFQDAAEAARKSQIHYEKVKDINIETGEGLTKDKIIELGLAEHLLDGNNTILENEAAIKRIRELGLEDGLKGTSGLAAGTKSLGAAMKKAMGPLALIAIAAQAVQALGKAMFESQKRTTLIAREFGITRDSAIAMRKEMQAMVASSGKLYVNVERLLAAQTMLVNQLDRGGQFSQGSLETILLLTKRMGLTDDVATKVAARAEAFGINSRTNIDTIMQMNNELYNSGQSTATIGQLMNSVSEATGQVAASLGFSNTNIAKAVNQVRKFGLNLLQARNISEGLLDFEKSLNAELEAELFLGRDINLDRARALSMVGDIPGATAEVMKITRNLTDEQRKSPIIMGALADVLSISVDELQDAHLLETDRARQGQQQIENYQKYTKMVENQMRIEKEFKQALLKLDEEIALATAANDADELKSLQEQKMEIERKIDANQKFVEQQKANLKIADGMSQMLEENFTAQEAFNETVAKLKDRLVEFTTAPAFDKVLIRLQRFADKGFAGLFGKITDEELLSDPNQVIDPDLIKKEQQAILKQQEANKELEELNKNSEKNADKITEQTKLVEENNKELQDIRDLIAAQREKEAEDFIKTRLKDIYDGTDLNKEALNQLYQEMAALNYEDEFNEFFDSYQAGYDKIVSKTDNTDIKAFAADLREARNEIQAAGSTGTMKDGLYETEEKINTKDFIIRPGQPVQSFDKGDLVLGGTNLLGGGGNNSKVEKKLDAILAAIQAGGDVYIDGNKAGRAMVLGTQNFS